MRPAIVILVLGVTQIIGYGSLYYSYAILSPGIAAEFAVSEAWLFAVLSAGLLLGGVTAPRFGGAMDRHGAPAIMTAGSAIIALLLVLLAVAPGFRSFAVLVVVIEVLSFMVLYDAAFAALARLAPDMTRTAITRLTLIAGFASTLFWPLTGWLADSAGWRGTYLVFAALNAGIALPLHLWLARVRPPAPRAVAPGRAAPPPDRLRLTGPMARRAFWLVGVSFALTGMAIVAIGVHMVPILLDRGLGDMAYVVAMAMGPAQVLIRVVDATLWRQTHPVAVAVIAAAAVPAAVAALLLPGPAVPLAIAFAVLFGTGGGLSSIVRGAVPVALFGTDALGLRLGRLAALRSVLGALAPFLFAWTGERFGTGTALGVTAGLALAGLGVLAWLWRDLRRAASP